MDLLLTSHSIKRLLYLVILTFSIFYTYDLVDSTQHYWIIWIAFLLSLFSLNNTFFQRVTIIFITGYASALAVLAAGNLQAWPWALALYLFVLITMCTLINQYQPKYFLPTIIISLFAILGSVFLPSQTENISRYNFMMVGMFGVLLLQIIFWPYYHKSELKYAHLQCLYHLRELTKEIFACFLQPDYSTSVYLYERRVHLQKIAFLQWQQRLRELGEDKSAHLDQLFDLTLDYSLLRIRVTDYSTFEVCKNELAALMNALTHIYQTQMAGKQINNALQTLEQKIKLFEENFQNVLNVAARDPLVFLLFISSMKNLHKCLEDATI